MEKYVVCINYQSTSGNPLTKMEYVFAETSLKALNKLSEKVRRKRNCLKINGGDSILISNK